MRLGKRYKKPKLPDGDFFLVDQGGYEIGPLNTDSMGDNGDNEFVWSNDSTAPFFLRITSQRGRVLTTVDGEGVEHVYTVQTRRLKSVA